MKSKIRKISKEEKVIRLLDYLKEYTDQNNPASIPQIERYFESKGYEHFFGNKDTRKNMIKKMVLAMNTDIDGNLLPQDEWRVVYNDFIKEHSLDGEPPESHHIVNIYYKKEFSDDEIGYILRSIELNPNLSLEDKISIGKKVRSNLCNKNYGERSLTPAQRAAQERRKREHQAYMKYMINRKCQNKDW